MLAVDSVQEEQNYLINQYNEENEVISAIEIRETSQHAGQLYCWLNEAFWGKGLLHETMCLVSQEYFKNTEIFLNAHVDVKKRTKLFRLKKSEFTDSGFIKGLCGKQYELILRKK